MNEIDMLKETLTERFEMKDLDEGKRVLDMNILRNR